MAKTKTQAAAPDKASLRSVIQKQPKTPEQQAGPSPTAQTTTSMLPPLNGNPSAMRTADVMMAPGQGVGHTGRARMMSSIQRTLGNRAVGRLIQAKLTISHPHDPYEREADHVADTVMRMAEPEATEEEALQVQAKPLAAQITPPVQRTPAQPMEEEEKKTVAPQPLVQRVPVAVREDDEEEKVASKLDTSPRSQEEEAEKPVQAKLETDTAIQRQAREDEEKREEMLPAAPPIQRQIEDEETVQKKLLSGPLPQTPTVSLFSVPSSGYGIQRLCAECEDELTQTKPFDNGLFAVRQPGVQRKEGPALTSSVTPSVSENIRALQGGGNPLPQATREFFEPRFGADFSQVRVHTGARAGETTKSINAKAFTVGRDIAFGAGQYAPESQEGRRLLAHELTHTVQQGSAKNNSPAQFPIQKTSGHQVMRSLALDSTVKICHRELTTRNIKVSQGGLRVVLLINELDTGIPDCQNHKFWVILTKSVDWGFDDEIATCEAKTGGTRSFSFSNLSSGSYYLTIARAFDHPYCCIEGDILVFDERIRGDSSGCVRDKDPSAMDIVHGALDIAGFIPVLGAIPDGINAAIYVVEGDWANAGLSAVAMVPAWGDGVKLGAIAGKNAIKISEKAAIKLGEEGIAKGLKEVKAASKAEKAALETTEEAAKAAKAEKATAAETAKAEKKTAETEGASKKKEEKGRKPGGKYTCYGWSAVLQIPSALPEFKCPLDGQYIQGPSISASSENAACLAAKHAFNAMMPRGCRPKHLDCRCSKR